MSVQSQNGPGKPFLAALQGVVGERPPFWLMRQAGRYLPEYRDLRQSVSGFLELCYTPDLAVEVTLQPIRRFKPDAAILFADILLVPDALGQDVAFKEGEGPVLDPVRTVEAVRRLEDEGLHDHLAPVYETVKRLRTELPDDVALIGFAGAPWTVATYMVEGGSSKDFSTVKRWALSDPDGFGELMDRLVSATVDYLDQQVQAGAEALQLFDTWAGALPEVAYRRWCLEPIAAIARAIRDKHPSVPVIAFPRGSGMLYETVAKSGAVQGLSLDSSVPLDWAAQALQPHCTVQGNLDPQLLVVGGEPMQAEIDRILDTLGHGPFVFNLGHGIVPYTPVENVLELADQIRSWRRT
ncbi:MAG: uroporphyrinogen decarboxylase [Minwuiales bacterium]|nr:uroporphyrinogen decarboxylase [Minwuiales bacterium]